MLFYPQDSLMKTFYGISHAGYHVTVAVKYLLDMFKYVLRYTCSIGRIDIDCLMYFYVLTVSFKNIASFWLTRKCCDLVQKPCCR